MLNMTESRRRALVIRALERIEARYQRDKDSPATKTAMDRAKCAYTKASNAYWGYAGERTRENAEFLKLQARLNRAMDRVIATTKAHYGDAE